MRDSGVEFTNGDQPGVRLARTAARGSEKRGTNVKKTEKKRNVIRGRRGPDINNQGGCPGTRIGDRFPFRNFAKK